MKKIIFTFLILITGFALPFKAKASESPKTEKDKTKKKELPDLFDNDDVEIEAGYMVVALVRKPGAKPQISSIKRSSGLSVNLINKKK